jgi:hypothetical protein
MCQWQNNAAFRSSIPLQPALLRGRPEGKRHYRVYCGSQKAANSIEESMANIRRIVVHNFYTLDATEIAEITDRDFDVVAA